MRGIVAVFFFIPFFQLSAQDWPFERWHEGRIVLLSGDTLKGLVKYNLEQGIVQYDMPNVQTTAFTARKVIFFEIYDTAVRQYRKFFALPYSATSTYKVPTFFELLTEGKITVLAREALEYVNYSSPYYIGSYSRLELVNSYFVLEQNGNIIQFEPDKKTVLGLMNYKAELVEDYAKEHHLRYGEKYDLTNMIKFYNSLF